MFATGGFSQVSGFDARLKRDLTSVLPVGAPINVTRARDPCLDAWRGLAKFSRTEDFRKTVVTLEDYMEKGGEYIKEHDLSNSYRLL